MRTGMRVQERTGLATCGLRRAPVGDPTSQAFLTDANRLARESPDEGECACPALDPPHVYAEFGGSLLRRQQAIGGTVVACRPPSQQLGKQPSAAGSELDVESSDLGEERVDLILSELD